MAGLVTVSRVYPTYGAYYLLTCATKASQSCDIIHVLRFSQGVEAWHKVYHRARFALARWPSMTAEKLVRSNWKNALD